MPCDAILIDGGCVVDEGMLTGMAGAPRLQPPLGWLRVAAIVVLAGSSSTRMTVLLRASFDAAV